MKVPAVETTAAPERVWELISRPARWQEWSPYVGGGGGLGSPEVVAGSHGSVVLKGGVRLPARITEVRHGESWTWESMGLRIRHGVAPRAGGGATIEHEVEATSLLTRPLALGYVPVVALIARNIARVAERG